MHICISMFLRTGDYCWIQGEDWNSVMYSGMRASGSMACVYFVLLLVVGDYLVMNLFIAILLSSFETHRKEVQAKRAKVRALGRSLSCVDGVVGMKSNRSHRVRWTMHSIGPCIRYIDQGFLCVCGFVETILAITAPVSPTLASICTKRA